MPTYDYECKRCGARFELKRSFNDNGHVSCPNCQGETQQIFTSVPIIFKGSGFYSTDNRPSDYTPQESSPPDESSSEKVEATATDSSDSDS